MSNGLGSKQDHNAAGQEASDFPILCETCLGPNRASLALSPVVPAELVC